MKSVRLALTVETVRARIKRGLEKLRQRIDGQFGSRAAWLVPLADHAGFEPTGLVASTSAAGLWSVLVGTVLCVALICTPAIDFGTSSDLPGADPIEGDARVAHTKTAIDWSLREVVSAVGDRNPLAREDVGERPARYVVLTRACDVLQRNRMMEVVPY